MKIFRRADTPAEDGDPRTYAFARRRSASRRLTSPLAVNVDAATSWMEPVTDAQYGVLK